MDLTHEYPFISIKTASASAQEEGGATETVPLTKPTLGPTQQ